MTKAEMIERYGIEQYERRLELIRARQKKRYYNDLEFHDRAKNDLNFNGKPKNNIRVQSNQILFRDRKHTRLKGYEIHHCFGYDDPKKFIYVPKSLHSKIHQFLRDNNIDADSNHYKYIASLINECTEYTYISA